MFRTTEDMVGTALGLMREKKCAEALPYLEQLVGRYPNEENILCLLGTAYVHLGHYGIGIVTLERARSLGCKAIEVVANLANAYRMTGNLVSAKLLFEETLAIPNPPSSIYANAASLYINESCPEKAVMLCDEALRIDPNDSLASFNRSLAYLELGRWEEGFRDYHHAAVKRGDRKHRDYGIPGRPCPQWEGASGQTVVVYGEQGIGDEIMFASCIPDLIAVSKQVIIDCDVRLEPLFRRSFPGAVVYGTLGQDEVPWPWYHTIDASVQIGSLPMFFRKTAADFPRKPFLTADEWQTERWKHKLAELGPKRKIGISWIGGLMKTRVDQRSIPLEFWGPILSQDADFISLQWHEGSEEEAKKHGMHAFPEMNQCFDFTASLMNALDMVISVTNTNIHLAGALGKECWCLTPKNPAWMFGLDGPMPWYDVKMCRQKHRESWEPVIERVASDLRVQCQR